MVILTITTSPSGVLIHNISLHTQGIGQLHVPRDVLQFSTKRS